MSVESPWPDIGNELDNFYLNSSDGHPEYFFHQAYNKDDFLYCLVPAPTWEHPDQGTLSNAQNIFFGTKILNIFIAQKPYGWVPGGGEGGGGYSFAWDDPGSAWTLKVNDFIAQLNHCYKRFPYYHTKIYVDMWTALRVQAECPQSDMPQMMCRTATKLKELCLTTKGFEWGGIIRSQVPADYFKPTIDAFYGNPLYKSNLHPL